MNRKKRKLSDGYRTKASAFVAEKQKLTPINQRTKSMNVAENEDSA
jgi:hypothetical protein